jgi:hypothetical protein
MQLAGKYAQQASVSDVVKLAKTMMPGKQLAAGDQESELVARLVSASMKLGLDPGTVVQQVVGQ